jgi:hypothetical protein
MTVPRDSEAPHTDPVGRRAAPLDYATPPKPLREAETAARAFAKGALVGSFVVTVAVALHEGGIADEPVRGGCAVLFYPLMMTGFSTAMLVAVITVREWRAGEPLKLKSPLIGNASGFLSIVIAGALWYLMWRSGHFAPRDATSTTAWVVPILIGPAVAPLWIVRRYR